MKRRSIQMHLCSYFMTDGGGLRSKRPTLTIVGVWSRLDREWDLAVRRHDPSGSSEAFPLLVRSAQREPQR